MAGRAICSAAASRWQRPRCSREVKEQQPPGVDQSPFIVPLSFLFTCSVNYSVERVERPAFIMVKL